MSNPWPWVKFGEILDGPLRNGVSPSTDGDIEEKVLTLSAITGARFDASFHKVGRFRSSPPSQYRVSSSDLLICRGNGNRTLVGRGFIPNEDQTDLVFPDTIIAARLSRTKIERSYVQYLWNSPLVRAQIELRARTTNGTFKINQEMLHEILMPLPPLEKQEAVAATLVGMDGLRALRRRTLRSLDELVQSIFADVFGDVGTASSAWPLAKLGDCVEEFRYGTSRKSGLEGKPVLRIPNVIHGELDLSELKVVPASNSEFKRLQLRDGDLLFVRTNGNRDYVGRCAIFEQRHTVNSHFSADDFIYASYLIRARLNLAVVHPYFVRSFLLGPTGRAMLKARSKTSAGQFNINIEGLSTVDLALPPLELQREFARRVAAVEELKAKQRGQLQQLDELFNAVQDEVFPGNL